MEIESNNEIVSFTQYLLMNNYTVRPAGGGLKKTTFLASKGEDEHYVIELGVLGSDEKGYGICRIENPGATDKPISQTLPITEFDPESGIKA